MANYAEIEREAKIYLDECVQNDKIDPALFDEFTRCQARPPRQGRQGRSGRPHRHFAHRSPYKTVDGQEGPLRRQALLPRLSMSTTLVARALHGRRGSPLRRPPTCSCSADLPNAGGAGGASATSWPTAGTLPANFARDVIHEGAQPGPDEYPGPQRADAGLLRRCQCGRQQPCRPSCDQCIKLIALLPRCWRSTATRPTTITSAASSLYIHRPRAGAVHGGEHPLHLLRPDSLLLPFWEAHVLDICLAAPHAEHGGGNNSTFTTRVVTSSGHGHLLRHGGRPGSLKGPKHGGANIKVVEMFEDIKRDTSRTGERRGRSPPTTSAVLLDKQAFDHKRPDLRHGPRGLLAVRPPRRWCSSAFVQQLARGQGPQEGFRLLQHDRAPGAPGHRGQAPHLQGRQPPTWTFTADLSTICWTSLWNCTLPSSPLRVSWAGARTASRSWSTWTRSSAPPTRALWSPAPTSRWRNAERSPRPGRLRNFYTELQGATLLAAPEMPPPRFRENPGPPGGIFFAGPAKGRVISGAVFRTSDNKMHNIF